MGSEKVGIPAEGDEIAGKYRVEQVIGQGGMGAVFAARNTLTGKRVAIKWLLPEHATSITRERLLREAQLAASVEHPNVVDIYDVGEHQGGLFLVMEYLRGRPLSELMIERGRFQPAELIALLVPAMRGVHAAHLAGVIHRDLKPENIILSEIDGELVPKVVDFGVSKAVGVSAIPNASLTRTGALVGTPHYMALEQIDGSSIVDPRTDVYAFGVLLYRGFTGTYPFDGSSLGEVILKIGTKDPRSMRISRPDLPEELDAVVLRALSRDLQKRYRSLEELGRALMPFAAASDSGLAVSWQGNRSNPPRLSSPFPTPSVSSLFPEDDVTLSNVDPAPLSAPPRAPRRMWKGALLALIPLLAGGLWLGLRAQWAAEPQTADAESAEPPAAVNVAPPAAPPRREARDEAVPEGSETPTQAEVEAASAADEQAAQDEADDSARVEGTRPRAARESALQRPPAAGDNGKAQGARSKQLRSAPTRANGAPALIPGRRTNGLSVDDF